MAMAIDHQHQRHHLGSLHYDSMSSYGHNSAAAAAAAVNGSQFNSPWSSSGPSYTSSLQGPGGYDLISKRPQTTMTMPYSSLPSTSAPSIGSAYSHSEILQPNTQSYEQSAYTSSQAAPSTYSTSSYPGLYSQPLSHQHVEQAQRPMNNLPLPTSAFNEALDGARGMVAMSQNDITPRNIYGPRTDREGYGFPSHSAHSSISSSSGYNSYYGSTDSSTDYSSASESLDGINSRTLPRPSALLAHALPPAPQSMMGSFNSKISSSSQKKHKCKICDKRFTRPSSLQTHMYSHTGEKRK